MSDSISKNFSQLFLPKSDDDGDNVNCEGTSVSNSTGLDFRLQSYKRLSSELWLMIFRNLERNDLDSCEHVCVWWYEMIRHNGKYLPGREIDYIMFSSKRIFSMILSSGNIIKMYRFDKYFTLRGTLRPIDHPSFMTVRTFRRSPFMPKPSPGSNQLRLFIDELRRLTNGAHSDQRKFGGVDAIGLHYPHLVRKTTYKIMTPPITFFMKLNILLRNLGHINFIVFQTFSLTDAFIERFMYYIEPKIVVDDVRLIRFKFDEVHTRAFRIFFGAILGNKHVLERFQSTGLTTMINWEY